MLSTPPLSPSKLLKPLFSDAFVCSPRRSLFPLEQVLHGDISQHQRDQTIKAFRAKGFQVLVATDVAARGIDVSDIDLVVQYRPPRDTGELVRIYVMFCYVMLCRRPGGRRFLTGIV